MTDINLAALAKEIGDCAGSYGWRREEVEAKARTVLARAVAAENAAMRQRIEDALGWIADGDLDFVLFAMRKRGAS